MNRRKYNKRESEEINKDLDYMYSIHKMSKSQLCVELMGQRNKAIALKEELDTFKFVMAEAKDDIIYIPEYRAMKNKQKLNK